MTGGRESLDIKVFISHQWRDKQTADMIATGLEGVADVWMDFRNLQPGDGIQRTIDDALKSMDLVLLIWTENAKNSNGVRAEVKTCIDLGVRIVPCIFTYDEAGNPSPALAPPLNDFLGVDFKHFRTGQAKLMSLILDLQKERLPAEASMDEHPGTRMVKYMKGYLDYLANYRNLRDVGDRRSYWVDKIISEIERFLASGGSRRAVRMLLKTAQWSVAPEEEGMKMLISRLSRALGESDEAAKPTVPAFQPTGQVTPPPLTWKQPAAPPADELTRRVREIVQPGTEAAWLSQVDIYLRSASIALDRLGQHAAAMNSAAGNQVVAYLQQYLDNPDDMIPDNLGRYGLLDDAWLILNTTFRLIESGLVPADVVPVDWRTVVSADYLVRSLMPPQVLTTLSSLVQQMLQVIANEVAAYQPWFTPEGNGYSPTMAAPASTGGCWEDQMNEALLGTGLSV